MTSEVVRQQGKLLLPFQRQILASLVPDSDAHHSAGNALLILARGLGLRSIVATLLKIYQSPEHLVVVVNATPEEERCLGEEVGMKMQVIGYEKPAADRQSLYKSGGLISVTSRILVVDMLNGAIPVALIAGLVVLHAEDVTPTSIEAFVIRIYRNMNKTGFIKAFSDEPEAFTHGMAPLQTVMQQLKLREVLIWPRFHEQVCDDFGKRKSDVVEVYQPLSDSMREVQTAVIECMEATLSEIKRSNSYLEVEDLTVENALFRTFDGLVRAQLDPVWHKVGPKTKGLVADLTTLRKLQAYLLEFDCVSFNRFLETVLSAQNTTKGGFENKNKSPWLFTTAADTIFKVSHDRVYKKIEKPKPKLLAGDKGKEKERDDSPFIDDDWGPTEEEEEAMRAIEESMMSEQRKAMGLEEESPKKKPRAREAWLPDDVEPVLEEQPKWLLLADVLEEIENDLYWSAADPWGVSNDTILVMCGTSDTCTTLREYLSSYDDEDGGQSMMRSKLHSYLVWKSHIGRLHRNVKRGWGNKNKVPTGPVKGNAMPNVIPTADGSFESAAMKRKREWQRGQAPAGKRRRVRGGGAVGGSGSTHGGQVEPPKTFVPSSGANGEAFEAESTEMADFMDATTAGGSAPAYMLPPEPQGDVAFSEIAFNEYFGLLPNEDLVILRPYAGDEDDRILEELKPKYIVIYDPDPAFIRRIEAYRAAHQGLAVRVYFLMYKDSVEEQRYLSSIRKEKDAFEKLIREKGSMVIPHEAEYRPGEEEDSATLRPINSRVAGGRIVKTAPPKVIVDVREFRSSLPSLLHAGSFEVVPTTISIGDYIITPEMCVERKSLPDLISSFNSGRLYQQCEQMTAHYKQPILLIEFDEKKSFNLETYAEPRGKGGIEPPSETDLRSKLVLLTISFPRLRIIWSSSPYQTVDIFRELKENRDEPDVDKAISVGLDEASGGAAAEGTGEAGLGFTAVELLRNLPGITTSNYRYVMSKVDNIEELCQLPLDRVQELIGVEKGKVLFDFLNKNITSVVDLLDV
ncbi:DNA repair protein rad16 [Pseudohyphozyma bogoriensis]|nr:DNA repair protein rad16 [Pseudohyphozyma bogoriensis]